MVLVLEPPPGVACVNLQGWVEPPVLNVDPHPIAARLFGFPPKTKICSTTRSCGLTTCHGVLPKNKNIFNTPQLWSNHLPRGSPEIVKTVPNVPETKRVFPGANVSGPGWIVPARTAGQKLIFR